MYPNTHFTQIFSLCRWAFIIEENESVKITAQIQKFSLKSKSNKRTRKIIIIKYIVKNAKTNKSKADHD